MSVSADKLETAVGDILEMTAKATEQGSKLWEKLINQPTTADDPAACVLNDFSEAFRELGEAMMAHPGKIVADQMEVLKKQQELYLLFMVVVIVLQKI